MPVYQVFPGCCKGWVFRATGLGVRKHKIWFRYRLIAVIPAVKVKDIIPDRFKVSSAALSMT